MRWLPWVLIPVTAALVWRPTPPPVYDVVEVPVTVIEEVEKVDTVVSLVERIVYREAEPETVATAPQGAVGLVRSFCTPSLTGDSIPEPVRPTLLLRSVVTDPSWFGPTTITLTGPTSTGDLRQFRYRVRDGWRAHVRGGGVLVQSPRWWWVDDAVTAALFFGAGYLTGAL